MRGDDGRGPRPTRRQIIAGAGASALALTAEGVRGAAGRRQRPRVRRPRRDRQAQAGRPRHPRRDGVERPRRRADGRRGSLAPAGRGRRQRLRHQAAALERRPWGQAACRASPICISRGAARGHPLPPRRRGPDRPAAGLHRLSADAGRRRALVSRPCCSPTRSPRTAPSSATCATTSSPARSACGAAFGINHGDVVFDDLVLYPRYLQILGATGIPWHHCPGNHDINSEARDDRTRARPGSACSGRATTPFSMPARRSSCSITSTTSATTPARRDSGRYCGLIGEQQLQFVRNVLAHVPPEQLVVLSMHIPLVTYQDPASAADNTSIAEALLELLSSRPHTVSFSGHMHLTEHHYLARRRLPRAAQPHHHHVLTAASGGWWGGPHDGRGIPSADSPDGNPNGFHVLAVDGAQLHDALRAGGRQAPAQLRAVVDGPLRRQFACEARTPHCTASRSWPADLSQCELVVNVFDGGPATSVATRLPAAGAQAFRCARRDHATPTSPSCSPSTRRCRSRGCARCLPPTYGKRRSPRGCGPARIASRSKQPTNTAADIARTCCSRLRAGLNPRLEPTSGRQAEAAPLAPLLRP